MSDFGGQEFQNKTAGIGSFVTDLLSEPTQVFKSG